MIIAIIIFELLVPIDQIQSSSPKFDGRYTLAPPLLGYFSQARLSVSGKVDPPACTERQSWGNFFTSADDGNLQDADLRSPSRRVTGICQCLVWRLLSLLVSNILAPPVLESRLRPLQDIHH